MGEAGRRRAIEHFGWPAIAAETAALYGGCWGALLIAWRSPAELLEHALGCSRLVLMNEAHDGWTQVPAHA